MTEITHKADIRQEPTLPEGVTSQHMAEVLHAPEGPERRDAIRDSIIGATLRVHGAEDGMGIIKGVEEDVTAGKGLTHNLFSRGDGLRKSVLDAGSTKDGMDAIAKLGLGLRYSKDGRVAMANMSQVAAYLGCKTEAESNLDPTRAASTWKQTLADEVKAIAETPGRLSAFGYQEGLGIDSNLSAAMQTATQANIDLRLLHRTAEYLRAEHERGLSIGSAVVGLGVSYDRLFKTTVIIEQ